MFANRFTAFVDACSLASTLRRNLLLSLAEAEFFRLRWSGQVLDETEAAIAKILMDKDVPDANGRATKARRCMEDAFEDAMVSGFDAFLCVAVGLPDQGDAHVLAAALKTRASVIVTENLKDFPPTVTRPLNIEVRSADAFIADTIALNIGMAVLCINRMRDRLKNPHISSDLLLSKMEAEGLTETFDVLRQHVGSL